jgi:hypothetical protein
MGRECCKNGREEQIKSWLKPLNKGEQQEDLYVGSMMQELMPLISVLFIEVTLRCKYCMH